MKQRGSRSSKRRSSHTRQDRQVRSQQLDAAFQRALDAHRAGDLEAAQRLYAEIISRDARHADARHLLGFSRFQSRQFASAIQEIERAIALRPDCGEYHHNLALAMLADERLDRVAEHARLARVHGYEDPLSYLQVGLELYGRHRLATAETCFQLARDIDPDSPEAHHYLGLIHKQQGKIEEAILCYERAIALRPGYVEALNNLGNALRDAGRYPAAIEVYRRALEMDPAFAAAQNNLGLAFQRSGDLPAAVACFRQACGLEPNSLEARNNLGNVLRQLGSYTEAITALQDALRIDARCVEAHANLGVVYHAARQLEPAIEHLQAAQHGNPTSPDLLVKLAAALTANDQLDEARQCYSQLEQLQPDQPLWPLAAATQLPTVFAEASASQQHWHVMQQAVQRAMRRVAGSGPTLTLDELFTWAGPPPFALQFFAGNLREMKQHLAAVYEPVMQSAGDQLVEQTRDRRTHVDRRIKIGFVVTPGKEGVFLRSMQGVISRLDAERFTPVLVCWPPSAGILQQAFGQHSPAMVVAPGNWRSLASTLLAEAFDILYYFEIGTDAANYFLPFLRLAPVQCTSWGIQVTSGITNVDYYLSSRLVEPADAASHYTETLLLADTLLCYRERTPEPRNRQSRPQFGFSDTQHLYVCSQQVGKFHTDFDPMIADILRQDDRGLLAVTGDRSGAGARRLGERWAKAMPDVAERIVTLPQLDRDRYRSLLLAADVLLDPPHFGGVNSTYDGLSYGKPIVTLPSPYHRGRYTLGCYRKMGVDDCIAIDPRNYVELATRLARERDYRESVSQRIRTATPVLFEEAAAVREHERLFTELAAGNLRDKADFAD